MATSNQNIAIGSADTEATVDAKLAAFVDGLAYPFQVNITNKGTRALVLPYLHHDVIAIGSTSLATINEPWQINDLFYNGLTFGRLHGSAVVLSVSAVLPVAAAVASKGDA